MDEIVKMFNSWSEYQLQIWIFTAFLNMQLSMTTKKPMYLLTEWNISEWSCTLSVPIRNNWVPLWGTESKTVKHIKTFLLSMISKLIQTWNLSKVVTMDKTPKKHRCIKNTQPYSFVQKLTSFTSLPPKFTEIIVLSAAHITRSSVQQIHDNDLFCRFTYDFRVWFQRFDSNSVAHVTNNHFNYH